MKAEREFFSDNLPVRIHFIIVMIKWTGLAPWELHLLVGLDLEPVSIVLLPELDVLD